MIRGGDMKIADLRTYWLTYWPGETVTEESPREPCASTSPIL